MITAVEEGEDPHILESNECRDLEERLAEVSVRLSVCQVVN